MPSRPSIKPIIPILPVAADFRMNRPVKLITKSRFKNPSKNKFDDDFIGTIKKPRR